MVNLGLEDMNLNSTDKMHEAGFVIIIRVHLVVVPPSERGLSQEIGEVHRCYTYRVNFWEGWKEHMRQGIPYG